VLQVGCSMPLWRTSQSKDRQLGVLGRVETEDSLPIMYSCEPRLSCAALVVCCSGVLLWCATLAVMQQTLVGQEKQATPRMVDQKIMPS